MVPRGWEEASDDDPQSLDEYEAELGEEEEDLEEEDGDDDAFLEEDDDLGEYDDDEEVEDDQEEDELQSLIDEGEALIEEGEYGQALELFREASERFPESPLALYHVGQTALMLFTDTMDPDSNWQDDDDLSAFYEEAQSAFESALALDEGFYPALNGQGALFMVVNKPAEAIDCWQRSLDITPDQEDISQAIEEARSSLQD